MTTIATLADVPAQRLIRGRLPTPIPVCMALAALVLTLLSGSVFNDPDTWWHVATGNLVLDGGEVPTRDPFSFSQPGVAWTAHEWLAEAAFALAFRAAGWGGVAALSALAFGAAALILGRRLARDLSGLALVVPSAIGLMLVLPSLLARPHLLAMPFLVAWTAGLLQARDEERAPSAWLLPLLVIWANLHGSFTLGIALVGPFALEALLAAPAGRRPESVTRWALFGVASLAAAALTPQGVHGLVFPFQLMSMTSLTTIGEWQPVNFGTIGPLEIALVLVLGVAFRLPVRVPLIRLVLLLALLHLALSHGRHGLVLGLVGPLLLAAPLRDALALRSPAAPFARTGPRPRLDRLLRRWLTLGAALAATVALGLRLAVPVVRGNGPVAPVAAVAALPPALRAAPVLNAYRFGGYLVFAGIRTYIDGRADMYGDAFNHEYQRIIRPDPAALEAALARDGIRWTIFPPDETIVFLLDRKPGWHRLFADEVAVVHVRDGDPAG